MDDFGNKFEDERTEDLDYINLRKRSKVIKQTISIISAVLILTISIFAALFVNARRFTQDDNSAELSDLSSEDISDNSTDDSDIEEDSSDNTESNIESEVNSDDESDIDTSDDISVPTLYGVTIDSIYVYGDVGLQYFASSKLAEDKFADTLNNYRKAFSDKVRMYNIIVPTYSEFYKFDDGRVIGHSQSDSISRIKSKLNANIKTLDIIPILKEHSDDYIYYRTDTNWSPLGAYYAYLEFMEEIGAEPVALKDYEMGTIDEYVGASYIRSQARQLLESPDYIDFYRVDLKYPSNVTRYFHDGTIWSNSQMVFKNVSGITNGYQIFGAETRYISVKTAAKTGKKLLVIRENSAAAFLPFLLPHFDEIHAVDTRYFAKHTDESIEDFVKDFGITDVLFMYYTTSANNGTRINELSSLLTTRESR